MAFAVIAAGLSKGATAQPRVSNISKQVNAESMTAPAKTTKIRLRGAKMQTKLEAGKMVLTGFNGGFGGGQVEMSGRINSAAADADSQQLNVKFANVALDQVLALLSPSFVNPALKGLTVSGNAVGDWQGVSLKSVGSSLQGNFELTLGAGALADPALLAKLAEVTGIKDLQPISFESGRLMGSAQDGQVKLTSLEFSGPDFKLQANGSIDLHEQDMDLTFDVHVAQALAEKSSFYKMKNVLSFFKSAKTEAEPKPETELVAVPRFSLVGPLRSPQVQFGKTVASASTSVEEAAPPVVAAASSPRPSAGLRQVMKLAAANNPPAQRP